ncbi:MAG: hypothetical protein JXA21_16360 [Anaerolineae bacterium]|nr:hypothetical protein [Anaerolineae bacterium]
MSKELLAFGFVFAGLLLVFGFFSTTTPGLAQNAVTPTPPPPTWTPGPAPAKTPLPTATATRPASSPQAAVPQAAEGAQIALQLNFPEDWLWEQIGWQNVHTVVQWQDEYGKWHVVEGWRGALDSIENVAGQWTGQKTWWASAASLGTGPFRWLVYRADTGALLAISEPFGLPATMLQTTIVEVNLD